MPPPLFVTWAESLSTKTDNIWLKSFFLVSPNFGPKSRLNLREDLFVFWSSPNFGQKNELILSGEIFLLVCIVHKFPAHPPPPPPPPPFENPAYATECRVLTRLERCNQMTCSQFYKSFEVIGRFYWVRQFISKFSSTILKWSLMLSWFPSTLR